MSRYNVVRRECTIRVEDYDEPIPAVEVYALITENGKILDEAHYFDVVLGSYFMIFHPGEVLNAWYHYSQIHLPMSNQRNGKKRN